MNIQPVFLKMGLNYPHKRQRSDQDRIIGYLYLAILAISIAANIYLISCLRQSWRNERALSESVNKLTPKWP